MTTAVRTLADDSKVSLAALHGTSSATPDQIHGHCWDPASRRRAAGSVRVCVLGAAQSNRVLQKNCCNWVPHAAARDPRTRFES